MSDIVKASIIIGLAIIISQGFYSVTPSIGTFYIKYNKLTGSTVFCKANECSEQVIKK